MTDTLQTATMCDTPLRTRQTAHAAQTRPDTRHRGHTAKNEGPPSTRVPHTAQRSAPRTEPPAGQAPAARGSAAQDDLYSEL